MRLRCEELMKHDVKCLAPDDSIARAAKVMRDEGVGFLPVCDEQKHVLGAITDRDIVIRACAEDKPGSSTYVREVMSPEAIACRPEDDIGRCEDLMARHRKSRIMVCDEGDKLVGVISLSDIAQYEKSRDVGKTLRKVTAREAQSIT
jgi:predicted transcriptional regulator